MKRLAALEPLRYESCLSQEDGRCGWLDSGVDSYIAKEEWLFSFSKQSYLGPAASENPDLVSNDVPRDRMKPWALFRLWSFLEFLARS